MLYRHHGGSGNAHIFSNILPRSWSQHHLPLDSVNACWLVPTLSHFPLPCVDGLSCRTPQSHGRILARQPFQLYSKFDHSYRRLSQKQQYMQLDLLDRRGASVSYAARRGE